MEFRIYIDKLDGEIDSYLVKKNQNSHFEIQNVIGDFIGIQHTNIIDGKKSVSYDYEEHVFTSNLNFYAIEYECKMQKETFDGCKTSFRFLKQAKELLNNAKIPLSNKLLKLNELQNYYGLHFDVNISLNDNPHYYSKIQNYEEVKNTDTYFKYTCKNVNEMVAAIIHYYIFNDYKLVRCKHCGKYYATQNLKQQYCKRISPYKSIHSQKKSRENNCESAVRWEIQHLKNVRYRIDNKMRNSLKCQLGNTEMCFKFRDTCDKYVDIIKIKPTADNLVKYSTYLYEFEEKGEWKSK